MSYYYYFRCRYDIGTISERVRQHAIVYAVKPHGVHLNVELFVSEFRSHDPDTSRGLYELWRRGSVIAPSHTGLRARRSISTVSSAGAGVRPRGTSSRFSTMLIRQHNI
jgi:hypothetical protein